jgi:hypothetical protein
MKSSIQSDSVPAEVQCDHPVVGMDAELKRKWVEALRSGKFKQGRECLVDDHNRYCCLGVLAVVAGLHVEGDSVLVDGRHDHSYGPILKLLGRHEYWDSAHDLMARNDGLELDGVQFDKHSFKKIAKYIEQHIPTVGDRTSDAANAEVA